MRPGGLTARQPCCRAAGQLGGRGTERPAAVAVGRLVAFAVGRPTATAENTNYIFRGDGSAKQRTCSMYVVLDSYILEAQAYSGGVLVLYIYRKIRVSTPSGLKSGKTPGSKVSNLSLEPKINRS